MKTNILNTLILFLICHSSIAQPTFEWAKAMGSTDQDQSSSLFVDNLGNIYTTGYFQGTVDFDPGVGVVNLTSNGNTDIFIQKLDPNGNFLWVKQMGGIGYDISNDIVIDANGNIYTTGYFEQTVDFDPGAGMTNVYSANYQIFIQKLGPNGDFLWVKEFGSSLSEDMGLSISIDDNGNVITAGYFRATSDFDPGSGVMNMTSNGDRDIFVQKLDPNGNFLWAKSIGDIGTDNAYSVETDISGNIYLAGDFEGTVDFDTGSGVFNVSSAGGEDAFILKLDQNGNLIWVNSMGGVGNDISTSFSIGNSGNIYVAGYFEGTVDFDPGSGINNMSSNGGMDYFIQKIDSNGDFLQVNTIGGSGNDRLFSVSLDLYENIYLTGVFVGTVDFDPSTNVESLSSNGSADISIQKLTSSGDLVWVESFGGVGQDYGNTIYVDQNSNVYTTGYFSNTVDFDPGMSSVNLTSNGNLDIFIQKLSQCTPTTSTSTETACDSYTWNGTNYTTSGTYTFSTTNAAGCDSTATLNLTIEDVTSPVADVTSLLDITSECEVTSLTPPTATDNCAGSIIGTHNATLPISASTTITWTYDDGNGNTSTQTQDIVIDDITAPVADNASLTTVIEECEVTSLTPPTATDNCVGTVTGTTTATLPISASTTITWTYDDGNGNTSTQTQDVVIDDITAPVADNASLTTLTAECEVTSLTPPTATDNCVGIITGTTTAALPISASTTITWTYDDGNGNTSTQTQDVVIDDITAPVADNASLTTLTEECEVTSLAPPTATDNCVGTVSGTTTATLPIIASTTITWTYDDGNGNTSTQTQDVVIDDVTAPVADNASLTDITSECEVTPTAPTATDNCVGTITGTPDVSFPITASGTTTITWTYDDGSGNTSTQTQDVIITPIDNSVTQVDPITLSADASGYDYQWVDCNNGNAPISGETAQTFVVTDNGSYAVEVWNGTCSVTSDCIVVDELGLYENETSLISVYPNPTENFITVQADNKIESITILNTLGQTVKVIDNVELLKKEISLPKQTGVYLIQVNTQRASKTIRIVKK